MNIAKLKELVTLSRKSSDGQEVENFEELQSNHSEEEIKQSVEDEFNVWSTDVQNNGNRRINRKFRWGKINRFFMGAAFSVEILNWAVMEARNPTLEACIGETICRMLFTREKWALS